MNATSGTGPALVSVDKSFARDWRWQGPIVGIFLIFLYYRILSKLVLDWGTDANFSHGFLVPIFSIFLVWKLRHRLQTLAPRPSIFGLVGIALGLMTLIVGVLGAELFLSRLSLLLVLAGLIVFFFGWNHFRVVLFPWAFLILMIPVPAIIFNQITFPLQIFASKIASLTLPWFGVPVLREGNVINLPSMPLEVAEACSGIRSLMSLTTLAIVYGYFLEDRIFRRVVLALCAVPIAVMANGFRIIGTGLCVQYWGADKAEGFFHGFSGWLIFMVSIGLLIAVQKLIALPDRWRQPSGIQ